MTNANGDLKPVDASVIVMGKCLEFYSQHYPLVTHHGNEVTVGEAVKRMTFVVEEVVNSVTVQAATDDALPASLPRSLSRAHLTSATSAV